MKTRKTGDYIRMIDGKLLDRVSGGMACCCLGKASEFSTKETWLDFPGHSSWGECRDKCCNLASEPYSSGYGHEWIWTHAFLCGGQSMVDKKSHDGNCLTGVIGSMDAHV